MTLPNAILFPQSLLPLHIFEDRYRMMLKESLESQRVFAVALSTRTLRPHSIAGLGLIRACVDNPDGTSNLLMEGLSRIQFTEFIQRQPYYIGKFEVLSETKAEGVEADALALKIVELVEVLLSSGHPGPKELGTYLKDVKDYGLLADSVTFTFLTSVRFKQSVLEMLSVTDRLHRVVGALQNKINGVESEEEPK